MKNNWKNYIPFVLITLSVILKLVHINTFPIQLDEPFSIFTSNLNWTEFWQTFVNENNPPLHPILLKILIYFVGMNDFWMRFISVVFSSVAVWFTFKSGEKIGGFNVGVIAGICMLFSNHQMMYAHQIRAYSLLVLLASMAFYFLLKILYKESSKITLFYFGLVTAGMMYTHFMGIIFTICLSVIVLFYWKEKVIRKKLLLGFLSSVALFLPYLPIFMIRLLETSDGSWLKPPTGFLSIYFSLVKFFNMPVPTIVVIVFVVLSIYFIFQKEKYKVMTYMLLQLILTFVGLWFFSQIIPLYIDRYLIYIAPILYVFVSVVVVELANKIKYNWPKVLLMLLMPILMLATFRIDADINQSKDKHWKKVSDLRNGKILVLSPSWENLNYCYYSDKEKYFLGSRNAAKMEQKKNEIYVDYEFCTDWKSFNVHNKNILVYAKPLDFKLKQVLEKHFVLVTHYNDQLSEYKLKDK